MKSFLESLKSNQPQLGLCIMYPAPGIIERIGMDWDWIWIDGQHGELGYQDTLAMVRACDLIQRPAFVRVPGHEFGAIGKALDMSATGVIVPVVDTVEEARAAVKAAKFPPLGGRSYGGRRPIDFKGRSYSDTANEATLLVVQIESPAALQQAEAIAAVPGVDALFLGPDDVMLRRGYSMSTPRSKETLGQDMEAVAQAARKHGKLAAMVGAGAEMLKLCLTSGFQLIVGGGDVPFLANGSKQAAAEARAILKGAVSEKGSAKPSGNASIY